ncbi:MAG: hypothetical protein Q8O94_01605, partial [bacterium]|nr:hypothetical protein [bacterium]
MGILITVVSGFASGVFLRSVFSFGWEPIIFVLLIAALLGSAAFLKERKMYTLGAAFFIFVALGM